MFRTGPSDPAPQNPTKGFPGAGIAVSDRNPYLNPEENFRKTDSDPLARNLRGQGPVPRSSGPKS